MGVGHEEAKRLTYWEFTALRHEWEKRHPSGPDDAADLPDEDFVRQRFAELASLGISGRAN